MNCYIFNNGKIFFKDNSKNFKDTEKYLKYNIGVFLPSSTDNVSLLSLYLH